MPQAHLYPQPAPFLGECKGAPPSPGRLVPHPTSTTCAGSHRAPSFGPETGQNERLSEGREGESVSQRESGASSCTPQPHDTPGHGLAALPPTSWQAPWNEGHALAQGCTLKAAVGTASQGAPTEAVTQRDGGQALATDHNPSSRPSRQHPGWGQGAIQPQPQGSLRERERSLAAHPPAHGAA